MASVSRAVFQWPNSSQDLSLSSTQAQLNAYLGGPDAGCLETQHVNLSNAGAVTLCLPRYT